MSYRSHHTHFSLVAFAFSVVMIGTTMPTPLYPIYREAFGFSQLMITIIFAAYAFGVIAALVITGRWSDQLGRRPLLFAAIAGFAGFAVLRFCGFAVLRFVDFSPRLHRQ